MSRLIWLFSLILFLLPSAVDAQDYFYPGTYVVGLRGFVWDGTWADTFNAVAHMRHSRITTQQYSGLEFAFFGTGYQVLVQAGAGNAVVLACVDNAACSTTDLATLSGGVVIGHTGLTEGFHAVRIYHNSASALNLRIYVVTILGDVLPESNVNVLNFPTTQDVEIVDSTPLEVDIISSIPLEYEAEDYITEWEIEDSETNTQQVAFSYSLTAGDLLSSIVGLAILFIALVAFMFWLYTRGSEPNG